MANTIIKFLAGTAVLTRDTARSLETSESRTARQAREWEEEWKQEEKPLEQIPRHANLFGAKHRGEVDIDRQTHYRRDGPWVLGDEPLDSSTLCDTTLTEPERVKHENLFYRFVSRHARQIGAAIREQK